MAGNQHATFRALHEAGCFIIPNPWDIGTAIYLKQLGFKALATTSAGLAFSQGLPDSVDALPRDIVLVHIAELVNATHLPVNADYQSGYAASTTELADSVGMCIDTGVAGLSIEDATGNPQQPLYELPVAIERIQAARETIDASGRDVLLTGRAECFLVDHPDPLRASIERLQAYAEAGADVVYAPGPRERDDILAIVNALSPTPVNILMSTPTGLTAADLARLGVRRISVGSALSRVAWGAFVRAASELSEHGTFDGLNDAAPFEQLNAAFDRPDA